jgi:hypothetical protein
VAPALEAVAGFAAAVVFFAVAFLAEVFFVAVFRAAVFFTGAGACAASLPVFCVLSSDGGRGVTGTASSAG